MKLARLRVGFLFCLFVIVLAVLGAAWAVLQLRSQVVYSGVSVAGLDLGGRTAQQARDALSRRSEEIASARLVLAFKDLERTATIGELGGRLDVDACVRAALAVGRRGNIIQRLKEIISAKHKGRDLPLVFSFDDTVLLSYLTPIARRINRPPVDARLSFNSGSVRVVPEQPGLRLDLAENASHIKKEINSGATYIRLITEVVPPRLKASDFRGIDGIIASYSTSYKTWERSRAHNIKRACRAINGFLLKPGRVFSYNAVVGPRLRKNGYLDAPQFVRGKIVEGTGGGVCQVSTTLYNAALLANLKIRERSHHSRPVAYVPLGRDATVEYGLLDLKFENTTNVPIYISAFAENGRVTINIFGKRSNQQVEILTSGHKLIPPDVHERQESRLKPGESVVEQPGREGHRVEVYRVIKVGGKIVRRELISRNYYPPEPRIIAVGRAM